MSAYEDLKNIRLMTDQDKTVVWEEFELPDTTVEMLDKIVARLNADGFPATRDDLIGEGIRSYLKIPREQLEAFLAGDWSPTAHHKES